MAKRLYPPKGTRLRRFLDAILSRTLHLYPEFMQEVDHYNLMCMVEELRSMGFPIEVRVVAQPTREHPARCVADFVVGDDVCEAVAQECVDD